MPKDDRAKIMLSPLRAVVFLFRPLILTALLAACAATPPAPDEPAPITVLKRATAELPPADVLNVNIVVFAADVPHDPKNPDIAAVYTDIRQAEGRYIPYQLRRVLEASGQWGDVRVVPDSMPSAELEIKGRIIESHGEELKLHLTAADATGHVWLDRDYQGTANSAIYAQRASELGEPFLDLYHRIANDLIAVRARLTAAHKQEIQQLAELRFATLLAPSHFAPYLQESGGQTHITRPPPADDPLFAQIALAAERDARLVDVLDQHYRDFYQKMQPVYTHWRGESYREAENLREIRRQAQSRKALGILAIIAGIVGAASSDNTGGQIVSQAAIAGGIYALASGIDKGRQQNIHVEALRELARSLSADLQPQTMELQDRTIRLSGSAEEQYRTWRELLALLAEENGAPPAAATPDDEL